VRSSRAKGERAADEMAKRSRLRSIIRRGIRILLVLGFVYLTAGYLSARVSPQPQLGVEGRDFDRSNGPREQPDSTHVVRGAISVHSGRSHDAEGTLEEVAHAAAKVGLDFVVLGDHPQVWTEAADAFDPLWISGALLVPGVELVVADRGRVLAVGLDFVPRTWEGSLDSLLAHVDSVSGFVSVVHPRSPRNRERWRDRSPTGVHAWEAFDVSEMARARLEEPWALYHLVGLFAGLPVGRTDEAVVGLWRERTETPAILAYDSVRVDGPITLTGGLNHHPKLRVPGGLFPAYPPFFRAVVNHVSLAGPLSADSGEAKRQLMTALRGGAVHISLGHADRVKGFRFWASKVDGEVARPGGTLAASEPSGVSVGVRVPDDAPGRVYVRFLHSDHDPVWVPARAGETVTVPGRAGVHRVEIHHAGVGIPLERRLNMRPWILSNPIEIRQLPPDSARLGGVS